MFKVQFTITSNAGYRPVSTILEINSIIDWKNNQKAYKQRALQKMCSQRFWDGRDLKRYGYTTMKARVYDPVKIEAEKKQRYEELKREKFASGEWTPTKKQKEEMGID